MPDRFTEVTTTGYGKRITNSFGGIIFGGLLFLVSFFVLYGNEGSVDYSQIAKTAVEINASSEISDPALKDKLLVTTAPLVSAETLDDGQFLKTGNYLVLRREVEMYSWAEKKITSSQSNAGGSQTTTTNYDYEKKWTNSPEVSSTFRYPEGHANPVLPVQPLDRKVTNATIGIYNVDLQSVTLPPLQQLTLNSENTDLKPTSYAVNKVALPASPAAVQPMPPQTGKTPVNTPELENGQYIYISLTDGSAFTSPQVGDVRISYKVLNNNTKVTLFGKLNDKTFGPYLDGNNNLFFQMFLGTKEEAIVSLHESYVMWKWIIRGAGFLMMWIGLSLILAPLRVLADILPMLGSLSGSLIGIVTFIAALILSSVTILAAMVFHSFTAVMVAIILVGAGLFIFLQKKAQSGKSTGQGPGQMPGAQPPVSMDGPGGPTPDSPP
jgi:hypothetical protein